MRPTIAISTKLRTDPYFNARELLPEQTLKIDSKKVNPF